MNVDVFKQYENAQIMIPQKNYFTFSEKFISFERQ